MNKIKMSLALFVAYTAGELVTTVLQFRKLNKALDNGSIITKERHSTAVSTAYSYGWVDAISSLGQAQKDEDLSTEPKTILDYSKA